MYQGKFDVRITARCPHCQAVTVKEMDYELEKDMLGKTVAEIIPEITCGKCAKVAFKRDRFDLSSIAAEIGDEVMKENNDKPKSIVLEVQNLKHTITTTINDIKREEKDDGEKHT